MAKVNGTIQKDTVTSELIGNFGITGTKNFSPSETGGVSTGWISGGEITAIGDATPDISAGVGYVYVTASDSYTRVVWNAVSNLTVTNNVVNYISVNSAGVVSATTAVPTSADQRTAIQLGRVSVTAGVITGITSTVVSIKQTAPQLYDLFKALGSTKLGLAVTASSTNLKLAVASGEIFSQGVSAQTSVNAPNSAVFTGNNPQTYRMFTQTGASGGDITDLPVGDYDNGGTVTAIPGAGTQATIFTIYKFSSGNVRVFYGQTIYANLSTAVQAIGSYNPVVPATFAEAIIIGYVAATKNATNLTLGTQAVFINTNRFGGVGGAVSSAGSFMFTDFSNKTAAVPISIGTFGSTPNSGGASYSADVITLQPADATNPGGVTTGAQTFAGSKTFESPILIQPPSQVATLFLRRSALGNNSSIQFGEVASNNWDIGTFPSDKILRIRNLTSGSAVDAITINNTGNTVNISSLTNGLVGSSSGTLANITALPSGTTATTQTAGDNSTKVATTAYVDGAVGPNYWQRTGTTVSPATSGDNITTSGFVSGGSTSPFVATTNGTGASASSVGVNTGGAMVVGMSSSTGTGIMTGGGNYYGGINTPVGLKIAINNAPELVITTGNVQVTGALNLPSATASTAAAWDASKNLVSVTNTGTGNNVLAASPTLTGTLTASVINASSTVTISRAGNQALNLRNATPNDRFQFYVGDGTGGTVADENYIFNNNTDLNILNNGGGVQLLNGATSWSAISDMRFKTKISNLPSVLDGISQNTPFLGYYNANSKQTASYMLSAQELQTTFPNVVDVGNDKDQTLSVKYTELIPVLFKAIQEQQAIIEKLELRIKALEK